MDPVDQIIRRWSIECPDVDAEPLGVTARVLLLSRLLNERCDDALASLGLTLWQYDVLAALRRCGAPYRLSPTELARAVTLSTAAMTHRLDRLESKGWIRRYADPHDRRGIRIQLTPAGRALVERAFPLRVEADRRTIAALPRRAQRDLAALLRRILPAAGDDAPAPPDRPTRPRARRPPGRPRRRMTLRPTSGTVFTRPA
ncbi:MAG: MarR family winged helix-turn-helix transcriptional regulator [Phycisphaerae bacterium]